MPSTEDELLEAIARELAVRDERVVVGVGDDAAVVRPGEGDLVLTVDALVEGTHLPRGELPSPVDLGHRAIAVAASDVAAMGASPRLALAALTLCPSAQAGWILQLVGAMRDACAGLGAVLVGGNLARGAELSLAVTVVGGVAPGGAVLRSGARPGDVVVVTGELGSAAAGRRLLAAGGPLDEADRLAVQRALRPRARVLEGRALAAAGATAMIDVSDGFALDLARLCRASGVGARVRTADLPAGQRARPDEVLGGGEDYELLATLPPPAVPTARDEVAALGTALTCVGEIVAGAGVIAVDAEGGAAPLPPVGWDHLA
ncbi:MAG: thiamine-monophosphate kinase [Actinomycetota bacterium]|nr:MAG: thiamine-monophosphate kinase [Actinomycetota bacterium]